MATPTIPISQIVNVIPGVVSAGGNALALNSIMVDNSLLTPITDILTFTTLDDVGLYYGISSTQYTLAAIYFAGFDNSTQKPGRVYFAGYASAARAAWFRGQSLAGVPLTTIQAVTGTLSVTIDGVVKSSGSINLAAATSFTNAAALLTTALSLSGGQAVTWDATSSKFVITSGTTGATSTMTIPTGTAAAGLGLSAGTLSQGADADTPAVAMERIKVQTNNWATFLTTFEPSLSDKTAFAVWNNTQTKRYLYIAWDTDSGYATSNNSAVFGSIVDASNYEGTVVVYNTSNVAAFVAGMVASIDWNTVNGRITTAFKTQSGLATTVSTQALADAVLSNNASYYGAYSAPGDGNEYNIFYDGRMNGSSFKWTDTYVNQIFLNSQLRLAIFTGLQSVNSDPYNDVGYSYIRSWCTDPIEQAILNGTIRIGVPLSNSQKAAIKAMAGLDISNELTNQGYYLQILPASAQVRQARLSPPVKLWYMDGGAIQQVTLNSIVVL